MAKHGQSQRVRESISTGFNTQKLFNRLLVCTNEDEVAEIVNELRQNKNISWQYFGSRADNLGIIQNQAKDSVSALVEKATNSIDAVILKHAKKNGVQPRNMQEAMNKLFGIKSELLSSSSKELKSHLQHIVILAEGRKERPTISIIDDGEGIDPLEMPRTILGLGNSNKVNIPFVQGIYGQGGSGVLPFCGSTEKQYHYMFVAARVHPDLTKNKKGSSIGFSLVRLAPNENVPANRRLLYYEYLADANGNILTVSPQEIEFRHLKLQKKMVFGCLVKLFDYQLEQPSYITFNLRSKFELKLVKPALPIWFHDARKEYSSAPPQASYGALAIRRSPIVRQRFSIQCNLTEYGVSEIEVIVFKHKTETESGVTPLQNRRVDREQVVMFSVNGQVHFGLSRSWFQRNVKMGFISKYLLVHVDLSRMDRVMRTALLSADRQSAMKTEAYHRLVDRIATELTGNHTLQRLEKAYASLDFSSVDQNELLLKVVSSNRNLSRFFRHGSAIISSPRPSSKIGEYVGVEPPTFLRVEGNTNPIVERRIPSDGRQLRLVLLTDATDEYMSDGRGKILASQHPELELSIHNTERGRTPVTISVKEAYTLPEDGVDVLFSLIRKDLSPLSVTVTLKPYEPTAVGPKLITIMAGAARGSAPVAVSPPLFKVRQGNNVKWFNDDYVNHEIEIEQVDKKRIVYTTGIIEPSRIHAWKTPDDIDPGQYLFRSINFDGVYGRLVIMPKKKVIEPAIQLPKVIFVTRDGRDDTEKWDNEWNGKRVVEAIREGNDIRQLKVNLDYDSFVEYRDINGPQTEVKIHNYLQTYFAIESIAVDKKLWEREDLNSDNIDIIFEQTMAGLADVLLPLVDVKLEDFKIDE